MQILAFDRESGGRRDIEPEVQALAESSEHISSARGRRLLELVRYLRESGPEPKASGHVILDELWISSADTTPRLHIKIQPDWYDYGPDHRDLSKMHFRISCSADGAPRNEIRAADLKEAEAAILHAMGWSP